MATSNKAPVSSPTVSDIDSDPFASLAPTAGVRTVKTIDPKARAAAVKAAEDKRLADLSVAYLGRVNLMCRTYISNRLNAALRNPVSVGWAKDGTFTHGDRLMLQISDSAEIIRKVAFSDVEKDATDLQTLIGKRLASGDFGPVSDVNGDAKPGTDGKRGRYLSVPRQSK